MHGKTLCLPSLPRGCQHGGLARPGITDNRRDPLRPSDMRDGAALLIRQPSRRITRTSLNSRVLRTNSPINMPTIDAVISRLVQPLGRLRHPGFDPDQFPRRIPRKLDLARPRVRSLALKLN